MLCFFFVEVFTNVLTFNVVNILFQLQVKCLVCIAQLLDILDKHIILDQIMPTLHQITSREPGVLMAILGECFVNVWFAAWWMERKRLAFSFLVLPRTYESHGMYEIFIQTIDQLVLCICRWYGCISRITFIHYFYIKFSKTNANHFILHCSNQFVYLGENPYSINYSLYTCT